MFQLVIRCAIPRPHQIQPLDIFHCLVDNLPRLSFAELIEVLFGCHARLVTAVLWHWIRNLNGMGEAALFRCQRIGRLELQDVTAPVRWINLVGRTILGLLFHLLLKAFTGRLSKHWWATFRNQHETDHNSNHDPGSRHSQLLTRLPSATITLRTNTSCVLSVWLTYMLLSSLFPVR